MGYPQDQYQQQQPADPFAAQQGYGPPPGQPTSGMPYPPPGQPTSGMPYPPPGQPVSGMPFPQPGQPVSGMPFPPPGQPTSGMPYPQPTSGMPYPQPGQPGQPGGFPGDPYAQPGGFPNDPYAQGGFGGAPMFPPPQPPKRRGLLITAIVLSVLVVLGGGGTAAFLIFGRSEGKGASTPATAVNDFLVAVFRDKNAEAADKLTCASARNSDGMRKRVDQLRSYELKYKSPSYSWSTPTVVSQKKESATLSVAVKLTTSDDRIAEQPLKVLTVKADGWLVCEINAA